MTKFNRLLSAILKIVSIVCIVIVTYLFYQNKDIGKYKYISKDGGSDVVFNSKTGIATGLIPKEKAPADTSLENFIRIDIDYFAKNKKDILHPFEY